MSFSGHILTKSRKYQNTKKNLTYLKLASLKLTQVVENLAQLSENGVEHRGPLHFQVVAPQGPLEPGPILMMQALYVRFNFPK